MCKCTRASLGMCDARATQLCAVAARQLEAVTKSAFVAKFYLILHRGSLQLRQLLTAVHVVRATFTEPRILEELAREFKISGQEVQNALSHLAADRDDKLSRRGNAPLHVVSVRCSSLRLYALWRYSSTGTCSLWSRHVFEAKVVPAHCCGGCRDVARLGALESAASGHELCPRLGQVSRSSPAFCGALTSNSGDQRTPKINHVRTRSSPILF